MYIFTLMFSMCCDKEIFIFMQYRDTVLTVRKKKMLMNVAIRMFASYLSSLM